MASSSTSPAKGGRKDGKSNGKDGRPIGAENQGGTAFASAAPPPVRTSSSSASTGSMSSSSAPGHDAIARRAYELYEQEGRQPGRDEEYWLRAEAELSGSRRSY